MGDRSNVDRGTEIFSSARLSEPFLANLNDKKCPSVASPLFSSFLPPTCMAETFKSVKVPLPVKEK